MKKQLLIKASLLQNNLLNKKNGINLACLEVEAYKKGLLNKEQLREVTLNMGDSYYQNYLMQFLESE